MATYPATSNIQYNTTTDSWMTIDNGTITNHLTYNDAVIFFNQAQQGVTANGLSGQANQQISGLANQTQLRTQLSSLAQYNFQQNSIVGSIGAAGLSGRYVTSAPQKLFITPTSSELTPLKSTGWRLGELTAHRAWIISPEGWLQSLTAGTIWAPGEPMDGKVSSKAEHCGIYCYKKARDMLKNHHASSYCQSIVYGIVHIWGDIIEHELGYRAEYAKIIALTQGKAFGNAKLDLETLRHTYSVPATA